MSRKKCFEEKSFFLLIELIFSVFRLFIQKIRVNNKKPEVDELFHLEMIFSLFFFFSFKNIEIYQKNKKCINDVEQSF